MTHTGQPDQGTNDHTTLQAENRELRRVLGTVRAALEEGYPGALGHQSQDSFEEQVWQSDRAHEAALPTVCRIREMLASDATKPDDIP